MNPEGQIDIRLTILPSGKKEVVILNNRPVHAAKLLIGKTIHDALKIIPLLYHVCGKAQGAAAIQALQAAQNINSDKTTDLARSMLCDVELIREHLLRIYFDWPQILDGDGTASQLQSETSEFMGLLSQFETALFGSNKPFSFETIASPEQEQLTASIQKLEDILEKNVFGCCPDLWLKAKARDVIFHWMRQDPCLSARCCDRILKKGWAQQGQSTTPFLPDLSLTDYAALLFPNNQRFDEEFIASPIWQGTPCETSSLSRCHKHPLIKMIMAHCGSGLLTRYVARLVELALVFARIKQAALKLASQSHTQIKTLSPQQQQTSSKTSSFGVGMVDAARGLLVHGVLLEGDEIRDYKILAPTEWNFHPEGVLSNSLSQIRGQDEAKVRDLADLLIPAIDPCTKTSLEVIHA